MPRTDPASGGTLPVEVSSFVGRRHELNEVKGLLGTSRLVTLTGMGGTGKTRLAGRVASELRRTSQLGTWFVDLTSLRAPELLGSEVQDPEVLAYLMMGALGLRAQPDGTSSVEQLVQYLAPRRSLLVMDNCEHLLPVSAVLTEVLLRGSPSLTILATSREPLLLNGEVLFAVPPLPLPGPGAGLAQVQLSEAVALFAERAQAVAPSFALDEHNADVVAELCRRLDGLPLAIELAAAWVPVLDPQQILARSTERFDLLSRGSRTAPERQQTLRGSVEWSFDLCAKPERLLWARLSVFVGGFELDAIEGICADEKLPVEDLLEVAGRLLDKSILVRDATNGGTARYRMLETLRDYGQEKLADWGEHDELRRRHRDWHIELVRRAEADLISSREPEWLARIDRELPNIRAALAYSLAGPEEADAALTVVGSLFLYWSVRALTREGRSWAGRALDRPGGPSMARLKVLFTSVGQACIHGDLPAATMRVRQAQEVAAQLADARAQPIADYSAAILARTRGDLADAVGLFQRACDGLAAEEEGSYLVWRVAATVGLALTHGLLGDADAAADCHASVLAICQPRGESCFVGYSLLGLGVALWKRDDLETAAARLREGLRHGRQVGDSYGSVGCLEAMAWIAFDKGWADTAATLLAAVARLADAMGTLPAVWPQMAGTHERYEQRTRDALGEEAYQAAAARGEQMSLDEAVAHALEEEWQPTAAGATAEPTPLTRREQEVAELVAQGLSNREIAAKLAISPRTAESHVDHILTKLGLTTRARVATWMAAQPLPGDDDQGSDARTT